MPIEVNTDANNNININVNTTQANASVNLLPSGGGSRSIGTTPLFGPTGNGIASIELTSTSGLVDTYTITFTNGNTTTFNVTNGQDGTDGNGIVSIEKTGTSGLVDTYTITYTDGNSDTFTVTNGQDGQDGQDGADGQDGVSPTATVTKSGDTATITITDANGTTTATITDGQDGTNGQDGAAATISVGTVQTGAAGTSASVTNSGTSSAAVFDFTIPKGDKGDTGSTGATGADGFSPTATVTKSGDTATITITDKNGTTTATVSDGSSGASSVSQLTDVDLTGLSNGDVLVYDSTSQEWKAEAQSGGGVDLIAGTDLEIVPLLPSGHTQLKSITATGSQYINTGIWLTDNFKAVIVGRFTDTTGTQCVLGATMPTSAATYKNIVLAKDASRYFVNNGNPWLTNQTNSSAPLDTNRHTFVVEITSSSTKISVDNTTNTGNYSNVTLDEDLFLFARNAVNASPAITDFAKFELEAIKIYNNGELVFNGVPAKYGNKAGIYDTVTSTFMPSLSATDFVAGEEVTTQDVINFTNETGYITGIDSTDVTTALGYTPYNASNPNGYITGISSSDVTTALGYTPYNSTNPNGYITSSALNGYATQTWVGQQGYLTSITSAQVTNALGYTPYNSTNPNGYISSAAVSTLTDVTLSSPTNGQGLVYNSSTQKWENGTVSSTGQVTIKDWTV